MPYGLGPTVGKCLTQLLRVSDVPWSEQKIRVVELKMGQGAGRQVIEYHHRPPTLEEILD